jgi:hypothetical protein
MSNPKELPSEPDVLELDAETVTDLEPSTETADVIRGGRCVAVQAYTFTCPIASGTIN